jgi:hypothetical protein
MLWVPDLLKLGLPAVAGFLLGLVAVAVIRPETPDGTVLLIITVLLATVLVLSLIAFLVRLVRKRRDPGDDAAE